MDSEITAAIIALCGVVLSTGISLLIAFLSRRYNYHSLYAEIVSKSRNHWLNEMRKNISTMLAEACKAGDNYKSNKYYQSQNQVLMRLNTKEPLHVMLKKQIELLEQCNSQNYKNIKKNIIKISEVLLKREWERVKKEAKGKGEK